MNSAQDSRRKFLKQGAALAGLAVGALQSGSGQSAQPMPPDEKDFQFSYGVRSSFETSARSRVPEVIVSMTAQTPIQDSVGIITPSALHFYIIRFHKAPPSIDPRQHRLLIHGLVDRPLIFTLDELKRLPSVSRVYFVECAGNGSPFYRRNAHTVQETHGWTSCSEWTGVPLSLLLREAGVQKRASWIVAESADAGKHVKTIPLQKAMDDVLVAYGQNGEAVRPEQGYPMRLLVPGWEGVSNVKWLRRINVVDQPYNTKTDPDYGVLRPNLKGKALWFNFELGPHSVITRPSGGQQLPGPEYYEITGLAWSGGGVIRRVEISTDGGKSWTDAKLQEPVLSKAHTRFRLDWNWDGKEAVLQSRCTDEQGTVQPTMAELAKVWGVEPIFFKTSEGTTINHINAIQPWKVNSDGSVHNVGF